MINYIFKGGQLIILVLAFFYYNHTIFALPNETPYVLLVSWDGCRWDYINRGLTPNLNELIENGLRAERLIPSFPTKTFPNHYTIVTGLYPENHGIIFNSFVDFYNADSFRMKNDNSIKQDKWFKGEAIWTAAKKQGIKSGSVFWVGSEVYNNGPDYALTYDHFMPHKKRVDQLMAWLNLPEEERPHFLTLYFADLDDAGHRFGPNSDEVNTALKDLDKTLGYLINQLKRTNFWKKINLILVTDHGMTEIDPKNEINLEKILTGLEYFLQGDDPIYSIVANQNRIDIIFNRLNENKHGFQLFKKADFPKRFHFSKHPLIGDIIILAEPGYYFSRQNKNYFRGNHGYDNAIIDMHGIFVAYGPQFKSGYRIDEIKNIDIYPLLCEILKIQANEKIDGDLIRVKDFLK